MIATDLDQLVLKIGQNLLKGVYSCRLGRMGLGEFNRVVHAARVGLWLRMAWLLFLWSISLEC
jgi:hypothetical protein